VSLISLGDTINRILYGNDGNDILLGGLNNGFADNYVIDQKWRAA
jgi:hypothetical protein